MSAQSNDFKSFLHETGEIFRFTLRFFREGFRPPYEVKEFIRQCYVIGYKSFPLVALIFAGKIGSSIGAELGSMKVTEPIDAMEVSGTNPF